jgi:hypothetical protein
MDHERKGFEDASDPTFCERCVDMCSAIQRYLTGEEEVRLAERLIMVSSEMASEVSYPTEYEEVVVKVNCSVRALTISFCALCRLIGTAIYEREGACYDQGLSTLELEASSIKWSRCDNIWGSFEYAFENEYGFDNEALWTSLPGLELAIGANHYDTAEFCSPMCDLDLVRSWIGRCAESHDLCHLEQQRPLRDLRVIDCFQSIVIPAPDDCQYVALSYVWGEAGNMLLQETSKLPTKLPATIEDSITATRRLGYRYLWVDKYVRLNVFLVPDHRFS